MFYQIKLFLNSDNLHFNELVAVLDKSLITANKLRHENSFAEMIAKGLRKPEKYAEAYNHVKNALGDSGSINTASFIKEAEKMRNDHLKEYPLEAEKFSEYKRSIVNIARKYLNCEKKQVMVEQNNDK